MATTQKKVTPPYVGVIALFAALTGGCSSPDYGDNFPCGAGEKCPSGYICCRGYCGKQCPDGGADGPAPDKGMDGLTPDLGPDKGSDAPISDKGLDVLVADAADLGADAKSDGSKPDVKDAGIPDASPEKGTSDLGLDKSSDGSVPDKGIPSCFPNPCKNGGSCTISAGIASCKCTNNWDPLKYCGSCKENWDEYTSCTGCKPGWNLGSKCTKCSEGFGGSSCKPKPTATISLPVCAGSTSNPCKEGQTYALTLSWTDASTFSVFAYPDPGNKGSIGESSFIPSSGKLPSLSGAIQIQITLGPLYSGPAPVKVVVVAVVVGDGGPVTAQIVIGYFDALPPPSAKDGGGGS